MSAKLVVGLLALILLTSFSVSGVAMAKHSSSSSSGGGSNDKGSSDSGSGSGSSGGSDNGGGSSSGNDNNNGGSGTGSSTEINNPEHPKKEDTKDISDIPKENGVKPIITKNDKPTCMIEACDPNFKPGGKFGPHLPIVKPIKQIININIILRTIHSHGHSSSSSSSSSSLTHGLSDACYTAMKQAWSGNIHVGQNAEIDKFMAGCLV